MKKYVGKALILMMSVLLFFQQFAISAVAATSEVPNLELNFKALQQEVLSGKTADFELDVKVTGSQTTLTNGKIVVNLPKHSEVPVVYPQIQNGVPDKTLTIAGVSPIYDAQKGTLTYTFPELKSGQVYKTIIQAVPELGKTPVSDKDKNIIELESDVSITVDQYKDALNSGKKTTKVISNGAVSAATATSETAKESTATSETAVASNATPETAVAFNATSETANLELYLNSLQQEVLSGKTANFELNVKVTGSQTTLTNGKLVVNLPKHPEVPVTYPQIQNGVPNATLTIAGVSPIYDAQKGTLTYNFTKLESGQVYKTIIQAVPELGKTPVSDKGNNIRNLEADAMIKVDEYAAALNSGKKTTMVISNGAVSISKAYTSTKKYQNSKWTLSNDPPMQGDLGGWTIKVSIPKTAAGLSYIQENSKIRIVEQLPVGLGFYDYVQDPGFTGVYNATNRTVTWEFDAPTFAQQDQVSVNGNLFEKELKIILLFDPNIAYNSEIENKATATYQPYGNIATTPTISASGTAKVGIASSDVDKPGTPGGWIYGFHAGAQNGIGGYTSNVNLGYVPTVTDDAQLQFGNYIAIHPYGLLHTVNSDPNAKYPDLQQIVDQGYAYYMMEYTIDPKLDLTHLELKVPYSYYNASNPAHPLAKLPDTFIQLKVNGEWKQEYQIQYPIGDPGTLTEKFEVSKFGKNAGEHVQAYRVIYRNASGQMNTEVYSYYDVYAGATGTTTNSVKYEFKLNDGTKVALTPIDDTSVHGNRHVNIINTFDTAPIVQSSIQFVDGGNKPLATGSNIQRGNNRIEIQFQNDATSEANIRGPLELVALLPKGVNILDQPNMLYSKNSDNPKYQVIGEVNGQQQIKFTFDNSRLLPKEKVTASFDVDVTRTALSNLEMQVYGFSANTGLKVPTSQGDVYTKSVLETDTNDVNKNGNTTQPRVKSANKYSIIKNDNLQITKQVKGSLDSDFSLFGHTNPDGDVTYRFNLTNTTNEIIEQFMFLDVLPSVGDLGITDTTERGSKFETTLKGPISFAGTKWQDQVTVYYSKSKNPKRDDLYATVDYSVGSTPQPNPAGAEDPNWMLASAVTNWNDIHSFKIVMKDGVQWLEGQDIQFDVEAKAPALPVDAALFDEKTPEVDRAAWNSFAVTTNGLLAVEPLRVGVAMKALPGSLELTKVDDQTGKVLSGATFELRKYESDNSTGYSVIASGTTDELGKLILKDLPLGSYKLVETKAPNDYMLLRDPIDVNITTSGEVVKLTVKNSKTGWVIPETGGIGTTLFYGIGVLLMIIALYVFLRKRNRNK
ncbi:SpaA isopeptide-forming pilin-related protein [Bacillus sp. JJ783]|uniref:SpaA isopeptide-forming pilin-related protein n=1 Tax=Bacillus sp. JJ783 TaxID=3122974 RepID=UPI0030015D78